MPLSETQPVRVSCRDDSSVQQKRHEAAQRRRTGRQHCPPDSGGPADRAGHGPWAHDSEDSCAVLLLGTKLATAIHDAHHLTLLSPATQAQSETEPGHGEPDQGRYLHLTDPVAAQQALAGVLNDNTFVLRLVNGAAPIQFKAAAVQSRASWPPSAARMSACGPVCRRCSRGGVGRGGALR